MYVFTCKKQLAH